MSFVLTVETVWRWLVRMVVAVVVLVVPTAVVAASSLLRVHERRSWALASALVGAVLLPLHRSDLFTGLRARSSDEKIFRRSRVLKGWWGHAKR